MKLVGGASFYSLWSNCSSAPPLQTRVNYSDCVRYLYSLGNELKVGAKFDLRRIQTLLAQLGNPERGQRFVHVAGTNGKGSTCAMIANVMQHAGFRTGLYTSPHLVQPTERIRVNGRQITQEEFTWAFETVHTAAEKLLSEDRIDGHPSYFETVTAMAFVVFCERCDISILEVGLGGRLDATNVMTPEICVLTPIAYDHETFLGNTLEAIAAEKAGILKPGVPVVLAAQSPQAERVISARAFTLGSKINRTADLDVSDVRAAPDHSTFSANGRKYTCALRGRHQIENAAAAIITCQQLSVPQDAIQVGLKDVSWPGRLEVISRAPDIILDGAHNPAAATALGAYIREFYRNRIIWLIYGTMRDKAVEEITNQLFPLADRVIVTGINFPRALRPETILEMSPHENATITQSVAEAMDLARTAPADVAVFISGSLFLVGEARALCCQEMPLAS